jgi:tetratricopeptide (TPR) repeat protein
LNSDETACPVCGETIKAVARKCKHCGEWLRLDTAQPARIASPEVAAVSADRALSSTIDPAEVPGLLARLVERSLVVFDDESGRYHLQETVRQYAAEKMAAGPDSCAFHRRHRDHYLSVAEEAREELRGPAQRVWLSRLDAEHDNIGTALEYCSEDEQSGEAGLRLSGSLQRFWELRGYHGEGRERYRAALAHPGAQGRTKERAAALNGAGALAYRQADYQLALRMCEEALSLRRELRDDLGVAGTLMNLGCVARDQGNYDRARVLSEETLAIARGLNTPRGQSMTANALNNLGLISMEQGEYGAARAYYEEALAMNRALGNQANAAAVLMHLGTVALKQDDPMAARAGYEEALAAHRTFGDRRGVAIALENLGSLALEEGTWEEAREHFAESLRLCREIGYRRGMAYALEGMAKVEEASCQWDRAACLEGAATALREVIGSPLPPTNAADHERRISKLRAAIGEEAFEHAFAAHGALTWEQAIAYALEEGG